MRRVFAALMLPAAGITSLIGLWWAAVIVLGIESYLAPTPPQVLAALTAEPGYLLDNAATTLTEVAAGYTLTVALAGLAGAILGISRRIERAVMPALVAVNAVPKLAFAPLLLAWMGFGTTPKIVMVVLICFFPIVLAVTTGLTETPAELIELARSIPATRWQTLTRIRIPAALPHIFTGLKTAMPLAVIGALVAELSGATAGLGYVITTAGADTATAFAAITLLATISVTLFYLLTAIERLLLPWARHATA